METADDKLPRKTVAAEPLPRRLQETAIGAFWSGFAQIVALYALVWQIDSHMLPPVFPMT